MKSLPIAILAAAITCGLSAQAAKNTVTTQIHGVVIAVEDGDTVVVLQPDSGRTVIRLTDIDAPEVRHGRGKPGQAFGLAAKRRMEALVLGRNVRADCFAQESYGRHVCRIMVNGVDAGAQLVEVGLAWVPSQRSYVRDASMYELGKRAQQARVGLWSQSHPVEPWVWRKSCWESKLCEGSDDE